MNGLFTALSMVIGLATRNLRRYLRRTLITTVGIALGTALSLFSMGLGDGGHNQMIENGVRIGQGHLTVQPKGYLQSPSPSLFIRNPGPILSVLRSSQGVRGIFPRIRGEGILATAAGSEGIRFQGIDPAMKADGGIFRRSMKEGSFLDGTGQRNLVIGEKLAKRLNLKVGKKAVLTTQDSRGEITSVLLRVKGIFQTGSSSIDGAICLLPLGILQDTMGMGKGVTSLAIYLFNPYQQDTVLRELNRMLPDGPDVILPWQKLQPQMRDFVMIDNVFGYLTYGIVLFIVSIGVLNTVLMSVMERKGEIGILAALGMRSGAILRMILLETAFLSMIGIGAGLVLGLGVNWYFSVHGLDLRSFSSQSWNLAGTVVDPIMYSQLRPHRVIQLCLAVLVLTLTMGIYPAWKASRIEPVEAMEKP
ncbi:MAG: ABC transporter permease [Deltaproteobacteria bacterium]|nr:ABC transporter permease [Deltaproteobacteria bacterium]